jgi:HAD superfamily hydrolase (TIGR01549 family)
MDTTRSATAVTDGRKGQYGGVFDGGEGLEKHMFLRNEPDLELTILMWNKPIDKELGRESEKFQSGLFGTELSVGEASGGQRSALEFISKCGLIAVPMRIKGVIFDMDGTITAPYFDFNKIRDEAGIGDIDMLDYLATATGAEHSRVQAVMTKFEDAGVAEAKLNHGARELLDELTRREMPTALLTRNTRRSVDGVCRKLNLKFAITVTREDGPHKPAPEPIWEIARRWGAEASEVLMVGDYKWDVLCAKNAGAPSAMLTNGEPVPDWAKDATYIITTLSEVIEIIEGKKR